MSPETSFEQKLERFRRNHTHISATELVDAAADDVERLQAAEAVSRWHLQNGRFTDGVDALQSALTRCKLPVPRAWLHLLVAEAHERYAAGSDEFALTQVKRALGELNYAVQPPPTLREQLESLQHHLQWKLEHPDPNRLQRLLHWFDNAPAGAFFFPGAYGASSAW